MQGLTRVLPNYSEWRKLNHAKKRAGSNHVRASSATLALLQISNDSSDDGGDDGGKPDSHRTHCSIDSTKGHNHSIDMADSTYTGNSRIHTGSSYTRS